MEPLVVGEKYHLDLMNGKTKPVIIVNAGDESKGWTPKVRDCDDSYEYFVT